MSERILIVLRVFAVSIAVCSGVPANAQGQPLCEGENWQPGLGVPGVNGTVRAVLEWDPDGVGPEAPLLVLGGQFDQAGDARVSNVAVWDGSRWSGLGDGLGDESTRVNALIVFGGELIGGGSFSSSGGESVPGLARWTGEAWEAFHGGTNSYVNTLEDWNGSLIVGGGFAFAGGVACSKVAAWDGGAWSPLGAGMNDAVLSLIVHSGSLVAGGVFQLAGGNPAMGIARWDGASWSAFGSGTNNAVQALASYQGALYAGGLFTLAGGVPVTGLARWSGSSWAAVAAATNDWASGINVLEVVGANLYAGGDVYRLGGQRVDMAAVWDGSDWKPLGSGTNAPVNAIGEFRGEVVLGGEFLASGGVGATYESVVSTSRVARWDGMRWNPIGGGFANGTKTPVIRSIFEFGGEIYVGGSFTSAPSIAANNIARWDGQAWHPVGDGVLAGALSDGGVYAMAALNGELYVGGIYYSAGGLSSKHIARWDGESWSGFGSGANRPVLALIAHDGAVFAGGEFTSIGTLTSTNHIARWNGFAWSPLDTGISGGFDRRKVYTLGSYQGELFAGGSFTTAGSVSTNGIARWNGSNWASVSGGIEGRAYAMTVANDKLYVGGNFGSAGGVAASLIASWDGTDWEPLGPGASGLGYPVYALQSATASDGIEIVIAGGTFSSMGVVGARRIAAWDGEIWHTMGSGMTGSIEALLVLPDNRILAGGTLVTPTEPPALSFAVWECVCQSDLNGDGIADQGDIQAFITLFLVQDLAVDFNGDGIVDLGDIQSFITAFLAGC